MIFIGDLYQLAAGGHRPGTGDFPDPLRHPYFFSAKVFDGLDMEFVELEKVYRQQDDEFIRLLNAIRNRTVTDERSCPVQSALRSPFRSAARGFLHP